MTPHDREYEVFGVPMRTLRPQKKGPTQSHLVNQSGSSFLSPWEHSDGHLPMELLWGLLVWAAYCLGLPFAPVGHLLSGFLSFSSKMGLSDIQAAILTTKLCALCGYFCFL